MAFFANPYGCLAMLVMALLVTGCQTVSTGGQGSPFKAGDTFEIKPVDGALRSFTIGTAQENAILTQNTLAGLLTDAGYQVLPQGAGADWILTSRWDVSSIPNPRIGTESPETSFQLQTTVQLAHFLVSIQHASDGHTVWRSRSPRPFTLDSVPQDRLVYTIRETMKSLPVGL